MRLEVVADEASQPLELMRPDQYGEQVKMTSTAKLRHNSSHMRLPTDQVQEVTQINDIAKDDSPTDPFL